MNNYSSSQSMAPISPHKEKKGPPHEENDLKKNLLHINYGDKRPLNRTFSRAPTLAFPHAGAHEQM